MSSDKQPKTDPAPTGLPKYLADDQTLEAVAEEMVRLEGSTGWQILMKLLDAEALQALDELARVDAYNPSAIVLLQDKVKRCDWFKDTLIGLIDAREDHDLIREEPPEGIEEDYDDGNPEHGTYPDDADSGT